MLAAFLIPGDCDRMLALLLPLPGATRAFCSKCVGPSDIEGSCICSANAREGEEVRVTAGEGGKLRGDSSSVCGEPWSALLELELELTLLFECDRRCECQL